MLLEILDSFYFLNLNDLGRLKSAVGAELQLNRGGVLLVHVVFGGLVLSESRRLGRLHMCHRNHQKCTSVGTH